MPDYNTVRHGASDYFTAPRKNDHQITGQDLDMWALTSNYTTTASTNYAETIIKTGWSRDTTLAAAHQSDITLMDNPMSVSSTTGYWTFPSVGLWYINLKAALRHYGVVSTSQQFGQPSISGWNGGGCDIKFSVDNFASDIGEGHQTILMNTCYIEHNGPEFTIDGDVVLNITNTSTDKIAIRHYLYRRGSTNYVRGDSTGGPTKVVFKKVG